jgi:Asp-tRNA(Asn)/Glu-tRNA(Gln) amidotransferase A subunit family amidase
MSEQFPASHPQAEGVESSSTATDRRSFLALCSAAGLGGTLLPGALLALATKAEGQVAPARGRRGGGADQPAGDGLVITDAMIDAAAAIAGITITDDQKKLLMNGVQNQRRSVSAIRELHMPNSVAPAFSFDPVPAGMTLDTVKKPMKISAAPKVAMDRSQILECVNAGDDLAKSNPLAFLTLRELAELVKTKKVTSTELTKMYLARLKKLDPILRFVITLTEERALKQAAAADAEIAAGKYRGPLHGIPWGGKDLLAVKGYRTTWGAGGFEAQSFDYDAEVVKRLDAAGAVLIAKLTMGALAQGDLWGYPEGSGKPGGHTRNPWNLKQGSTGSSAGSASAAAAGCVGFAIGTETLGSISAPSTRCGVTGLRPSFGLVPRTGAMALVWSMDKIGPITRSVEDCALVLNAIYGPDGYDQSVQPAPFHADLTLDIHALRIGYIASAFKAPTLQPMSPDETKNLTPADRTKREQQRQDYFNRRSYDIKFSTTALETLRSMGLKLTPVELPDFHFSALLNILGAEAAAAFDDLTTSGRDALLAGQTVNDWPNGFRTSRFLSAVDYIQAERARTFALAAMHKTFADFDVIVTPSGGNQLVATNLCGQPAVIIPNGLRGADAPPFPTDENAIWSDYGGPGTPVSFTFLAPLYQDAKAVALAHAYQQKTGFHLLHPRLA